VSGQVKDMKISKYHDLTTILVATEVAGKMLRGLQRTLKPKLNISPDLFFSIPDPYF
jgi:hypothetical protein